MVNYIRLAAGLHRFLSRPLSLADCWESARRQVEQREDSFLTILERFVYPNPGNPYRKLLLHAGCDFADAEGMVHRNGLEKTLQTLAAAGVYITIEEYRGRKPVERNGLSFAVTPADFDRPDAGWVLRHSSGGTRSSGVQNYMSFDLLTAEAATEGILMDNLDLYRMPYVLCGDNLPRALEAAKAQIFLEKWFFPTSTNKNQLASYYTVFAAKLSQQPLPWPQPVSLQDAPVIARWLAKRLETAPRIGVRATVSRTLRLCQAAEDRGLDLSRVHFLVGSEPLSPARQRAMLAQGCRVTPLYSATEIGVIARGCLSTTGDDMHVFKGHVAVLKEPRTVGSTGVLVEALRFTSLLPAAPKILINAENGDFAQLGRKECGCKFDSIGLTDHLSQIRSFEKLTAEGTAFYAGDVARIVEEVLPARFGGGPIDYQAIEEEGGDGTHYMALLVSPRLGALDEGAVADTFFWELRKGGANNRRMAHTWEEAGAVRIRREHPHPTRGGKVFPFHVR